MKKDRYRWNPGSIEVDGNFATDLNGARISLWKYRSAVKVVTFKSVHPHAIGPKLLMKGFVIFHIAQIFFLTADPFSYLNTTSFSKFFIECFCWF